MLWAGPGRTLAQDPAALRELGYLHAERAAILEFDGGLDRLFAGISRSRAGS